MLWYYVLCVSYIVVINYRLLVLVVCLSGAWQQQNAPSGLDPYWYFINQCPFIFSCPVGGFSPPFINLKSTLTFSLSLSIAFCSSFSLFVVIKRIIIKDDCYLDAIILSEHFNILLVPPGPRYKPLVYIKQFIIPPIKSCIVSSLVFNFIFVVYSLMSFFRTDSGN